MGPVTASNSCAAFANQLGLDEDRGQNQTGQPYLRPAMSLHHASARRVV